MGFIVPKRATTDTRGLPDGYDPHKFYEYAISSRMRDAKGLEWLLYQYMPISLIKSFAIAIDPFSSLKRTSNRVTKVNRTIKRGTRSLLGKNLSYYETVHRGFGTIPNYDGHPGHNSPYIWWDKPGVTKGIDPQGDMPVLYDTRKDTTRRTRALSSELGEFESQTHQLYAPPRSLYWQRYQIHTNSPGLPEPVLQQVSGYLRSSSHTIGPHAAFLPDYQYNGILDDELNGAKQLINTNVLSMYNQVSPLRRDYSLFRNAVELRDLPRSVASLQQSLSDLRNFALSLPSGQWDRIWNAFLKNPKNIPNEYLSYMFGWRQLYNDISDLLKTPDRITKKINFLLRRANKETTVRLKRPIPLTSRPIGSGFRYSSSPLEYPPTSDGSFIERSGELRIVMNAMFQFPDVMAPNYRETEFLRRLGVTPTPIDLYNLVPWSWLVDWFTGLNHYVEAISTVNTDKQLVNWCMITCEMKSRVVTTRNFRTRSEQSITTSNPTSGGDVFTYNSQAHTSVLEIKTIVRRDVATALTGVRTTADSSTLTNYQRSILGALLLQRAK